MGDVAIAVFVHGTRSCICEVTGCFYPKGQSVTKPPMTP